MCFRIHLYILAILVLCRAASATGDCTDPVQLQDGVAYNGNTVTGNSLLNHYPCHPFGYNGPEIIHQITVPPSSRLLLFLLSGAPDRDIFLLSSCDDDACLASGDSVIDYSNAGGTYYISVDSRTGYGPYELICCIMPDVTTLLEPPASDYICRTIPTLFDWTDMPGASGYTFQYDDDQYFGSPVTMTTAESNLLLTISSADDYYWRVSADGTGGCTAINWTPRRLLHVSSVVVDDVTLTAPADSAFVCVGQSATFSWSGGWNGGSFRIQWDDNPGFLSPEEVVTTADSITRTITNTDTTFWRVRGESICNGRWSSTRYSFGGASLSPPTLLYPSNGATFCLGHESAILGWESEAGVVDYLVQIDTDSSFLSPYAEVITGTSMEMPDGDGEFVWRVKALGENCESAWSASRTLWMSTMTPPQVQGIPDRSVACMETNFRYTWPSTPRAQIYLVEWDDSEWFISPIVRAAPADSLPAIELMLPAGWWYWHVRAYNECGWGPVSVTGEILVVDNFFLGIQTPVEPPDNTPVTVGQMQVYDWVDVSSAQQFEVQWSYEPQFTNCETEFTPISSIAHSLNQAGTVWWRVRGLDSSCNGPWIPSQTVQVIPELPPMLTILAEGDSIRLSWSRTPVATSYRIEFASDADAPYEVLTEVTDTTYSFVISDQVKFYRVRSMR